MSDRPGLPPELRDLMLRYCQLGRLLPPQDDWAEVLEDVRVRAEVEVVIAEQHRTMAKIHAFLEAARRGRSP